MKPRLLFYCQHVLGMGHLVRSAAIVQGLAERFNVTFINGGEMVENFRFSKDIEVVQLPPIISDPTFQNIHSADRAGSVDGVIHRRCSQMLDLIKRTKPAVLVTELFPFGRRKFSAELVPLLDLARTLRSTRVVSSVRDILVRKRDAVRFEENTCRIINTYYDLILVHSDPAFQRLEGSFHSVKEIRRPIEYTGYVVDESLVEPAPEISVPPGEKLVVVSVGGGRVGSELVEHTLSASASIRGIIPHRLFVFAGPYMPEESFRRIQMRAAECPNVTLERYTPDLCSYLKRADLSVSMAGYNTCMDIVSTGVRAIVCPFTGSQNDEQSIRAQRLEQLGLLCVADGPTLTAESLARLMVQQLELPPPARAHSLDLMGVPKTVTAISKLVESSQFHREGVACH